MHLTSHSEELTGGTDMAEPEHIRDILERVIAELLESEEEK